MRPGKKLYVAVPGYDIDEEIAKLLHYHVDGIFIWKHPLLKAFLHGGICEGYLRCDSSAKAGDRACWGH